MNIIIPMGGLGSRFQKEGYRFPKPLVNIVGRPMLFWLLDHLDIHHDDTIWIALNESLDADFELCSRVANEFPGLDIRTVHLNFQTRGASETLYCILQKMSPADMTRKTISLDCDTIYFSNILQSFREVDEGWSASFTFEDNSGKPIFSYVSTDATGKILDIKEKVIISTHANTGAYAFATAAVLKTYCSMLLDGSVGSAGEYYTSSVIKYMLQDGACFKAVHVDDFAVVGTPTQLLDFMKLIDSGKIIMRKKLRFCFDLDNTLVTYPRVRGDYSTVEPKPRGIAILKKLKALGHHIIICSARRMKTHRGNVGEVIADVAEVTIRKLREFQVPYDELHFGKPYAHAYVDDLAINVYTGMEKEIGWLPQGYYRGIPENVPPSIRKTVQFVGDTVIKSGAEDIMKGEYFFYQYCPASLRHLFPKLISQSTVDGVSSITTELAKGVTFAHLLSNQCITTGRLTNLMLALETVHKASGVQMGPPAQAASVLAANKIEKLFNANTLAYPRLDSSALLLRLMEALSGIKRKGRPVYVIHGQPLFSNVLLTADSKVVLIGMSGGYDSSGKTAPTLAGDAAWDLAHIYASLAGYDFIVLNRTNLLNTPETQAYLSSLTASFVDLVKSHYPSINTHTLPLLAAAIFFAAPPLHAAPAQVTAFLTKSQALLDLYVAQKHPQTPANPSPPPHQDAQAPQAQPNGPSTAPPAAPTEAAHTEAPAAADEPTDGAAPAATEETK